jgi:hypothetical protein
MEKYRHKKSNINERKIKIKWNIVSWKNIF